MSEQEAPQAITEPELVEATMRGPRGDLSHQHGPIIGRICIDLYADQHLAIGGGGVTFHGGWDNIAAQMYRAMKWIEAQVAIQRAAEVEQAKRIVSPNGRQFPGR